jgi:hypothetical protein
MSIESLYNRYDSVGGGRAKVETPLNLVVP